jgi:WhiB family transcriptional regulator, redox-sensing transcriptional regulator
VFSWEDDAACSAADSGLFFGPDGEMQPDREAREARARTVCERCPVRTQCLDWALSTFVRHGIWGGMNVDERRLERRRRAWRGRAA